MFIRDRYLRRQLGLSLSLSLYFFLSKIKQLILTKMDTLWHTELLCWLDTISIGESLKL